MTKIIPEEWNQECNDLIREANKNVAETMYKKYHDSLTVPMYLHVLLCRAMHDTFRSAPDLQEAERFVKQALEEVKEWFESEEENL